MGIVRISKECLCTVSIQNLIARTLSVKEKPEMWTYLLLTLPVLDVGYVFPNTGKAKQISGWLTPSFCPPPRSERIQASHFRDLEPEIQKGWEFLHLFPPIEMYCFCNKSFFKTMSSSGVSVFGQT